MTALAHLHRMKVVHGDGDVGEDRQDPLQVPGVGIDGDGLDALAPGRRSPPSL